MKYSAALRRLSDGETSMNDFDNEILPTDPDEGEEIAERVELVKGAKNYVNSPYVLSDEEKYEIYRRKFGK